MSGPRVGVIGGGAVGLYPGVCLDRKPSLPPARFDGDDDASLGFASRL